MMRSAFFLMLSVCTSCFGADYLSAGSRLKAEYYVAAYAQHYGVPTEFVRALVEQESGWNSCITSPKGAAGIMQLMPDTAKRLGVLDRCDINQSISGAVRLLAWLAKRFHGDLRLVAAAYYAGVEVIERRGLEYTNADVIAYVASIRARVDLEKRTRRLPLTRVSGGER